MKLKRIALLSAAAIAALSLASCKDDKKDKKSKEAESSVQTGSKESASQESASQESASEESASEESKGSVTSGSDVSQDSSEVSSESSAIEQLGRLDLWVSYNGQQGVTYQGETSFNNPVDESTYNKNDLLPTWQRFQELTGTSISDAVKYAGNGIDTDFDSIQQDDYASQTNADQKIDVMIANITKIEKAAAAGEALNLAEYLDEMPNFNQYLMDNPIVQQYLTYNEGIYYTPYYDGKDTIEKMINLDHKMVKALLDSNSTDGFDTKLSGKGGADNTLQEAQYQPFIDSTYNYPEAETEVVISKNSGASTGKITIKRTNNIIAQQNASLAAGVSGKELAQQFRTYLQTAFANPLADGTYTNLSDIFLSEGAAFNTDELIALMRLVKANPGYLTGDSNAEIEILCPRGEANNRIDNIQDFLQIWGVQGVVGEKDLLYWDANGKLNDAGSTPATYEALDNLRAIYQEGLIKDKFYIYDKSTNKDGTKYLNENFAHTKGSSAAYGFMIYDYNASTSACCEKDANGVGTDPEKLTNGVTYQPLLSPVLPPLSYWASSTSYNQKQSLADHTNKELMRFTEDNRGMKTSSWFIPSSTDNITAALKIVDIMFSKQGAWINNFGPEAYWVTTDESQFNSYMGVKNPSLNANTFKILNDSPDDMWTDMRKYVGSTHAVGNVRPAQMNYESTNINSRQGLANMENAILSGAVNLTMSEKKNSKKFDISVPAGGYGNVADETAATYDAVSGFWSVTLGSTTTQGWIKYVVDDEYTESTTFGKGTSKNAVDYTYGNLLSQRYTVRVSNYLYTMAQNLGNTYGVGDAYIPSYALK